MTKNDTGLSANTARSDLLTGLNAAMGYNGQMTEAGTGWQILGNGYRVYNPALMRFHSPDYLSPFGEGGLNAYAYCEGDPVNRVDPTGHYAWMAFLRLFITSSGRAGKSIPLGVIASRPMRAPVVISPAIPVPVAAVRAVPGSSSISNSTAPVELFEMTPRLLGQLGKKKLFQQALMARAESRFAAFESRFQSAPEGSSRNWAALTGRYHNARREYLELRDTTRRIFAQTSADFEYAKARVGQRIISPEYAVDLGRWAARWDRQMVRPVDPDGMRDLIRRTRQN